MGGGEQGFRADRYWIDLRIDSPASLSVIKAGLAHPAVASFQSGEELFEALAAHTPVGIFISSAEGGCLYVNERWCELTGLSPEQALGDGWASALHPDDAARVHREWTEAGAHGRDSVVEYRFLRPDGGVSWIEGYAATLRDQDGRVIGWVGTCLDYTARKEADEAVARAAEHFRVAFENAPIGMAVVTPDGRWLRVNPTLCEITGYSEEELLACTFQDITHPDDLEQNLAELQRVIGGEQTAMRIEKRYLRPNGNTVWVRISSSIVRDTDGKPLHFVSQIENVTERKLDEQRLKELADHDSLTGLLNRRRFDEELRLTLLRLRRHGGHATLLLCDLDRFKVVNDTYGHKTGDDVLVAVAAVLRGRLRETDVVARLGGDEFAAIALETGGEDALTVATDLATALRSLEIVSEGAEPTVTASIGVVLLNQASLVDKGDPLVAADRALYQAKSGGRDRIELAA